MRFRPEAGQIGTYEITVGVSDGVFTDTAVLNIAVVPGTASDTSVFGRVLDAVDFANGIETPLSGIPVRLTDAALMVNTDADGVFRFGSLTPGTDTVLVEPSALGGPGGYFPLSRNVTITASQDRDLSPDFLAVPLNDGCVQVVTGMATVLNGITSGVTVAIAADSIQDGNGNAYTGEVCLGSLPQLFAQPGLPAGTQACNIYALDAPGAVFTQGISVAAPNTDLLPEGTVLQLLSQTGAASGFEFSNVAGVDVGGATVSASATNLSAGSLFTFLPQPPQSVASADQPSGNRMLTPFQGDLNEVYTLPGYRAFNEVQEVGLSYHSQSANPTVIVAGDVTIADDASLPVTLSTFLDVGGLSVTDSGQWSPREGLDGSTPALLGEAVTLRQSLPVDASGLESGRYGYDFQSQATYACSTVSSKHSAEFYVQNETDSPYGRGWSIDDLQQLYVSPDGKVAIVDDDGVVTFDPAPSITALEDEPLVFPADVPVGLAVGDMDENGELDVVFGETGTGQVNLILNSGAVSSRTIQRLQLQIRRTLLAVALSFRTSLRSRWATFSMTSHWILPMARKHSVALAIFSATVPELSTTSFESTISRVLSSISRLSIWMGMASKTSSGPAARMAARARSGSISSVPTARPRASCRSLAAAFCNWKPEI